MSMCPRARRSESKNEYGSVGLCKEKKARVEVARQLVRIAKDLIRRD